MFESRVDEAGRGGWRFPSSGQQEIGRAADQCRAGGRIGHSLQRKAEMDNAGPYSGGIGHRRAAALAADILQDDV